MINWELVEKTLKWLEDHPNQHNQATFADSRDSGGNICKSTYCFAGAACMLAGRVDIGTAIFDTDWLRPLDAKGKVANWHEVAQEVLGITDRQAEDIFYGYPFDWRDFPRFKRFVYQVLENRRDRP